MILLASSSTGATTLASPASMAFLGMESNLAEAGSCTKTAPPFSLMAESPIVPSAPMPERRTPTLWGPWSAARDRKKESMGKRSPRGAAGASKCNTP